MIINVFTPVPVGKYLIINVFTPVPGGKYLIINVFTPVPGGKYLIINVFTPVPNITAPADDDNSKSFITFLPIKSSSSKLDL